MTKTFAQKLKRWSQRHSTSPSKSWYVGELQARAAQSGGALSPSIDALALDRSMVSIHLQLGDRVIVGDAPQTLRKIIHTEAQSSFSEFRSILTDPSRHLQYTRAVYRLEASRL